MNEPLTVQMMHITFKIRELAIAFGGIGEMPENPLPPLAKKRKNELDKLLHKFYLDAGRITVKLREFTNEAPKAPKVKAGER